MTITFISNYINHHQIPFSNACCKILGDDYHFIQTQPMEQERINMGWHTEGTKLPYVLCLYEEEERCKRLIMESDILMAGWSEREDLIRERLKSGRPVIRISERLYREGQWKAISPRGLIQKYKEHTRYKHDPVYLFCAGAYVPSDFHIIGAYRDKMFKWGYFPETIHYSQEQWKQLKPEGACTEIVWAGRFISLKHPEFMIRLAEDLKDAGERFHIHMAGGGEMEEALKLQTVQKHLEQEITFYGFLEPEKVRNIMEKCHIHIFTSNHLEGWGAVVNEGMNSGCAEVVNAQVGAAPYLIRHGENGLIYLDGKYEEMAEQVKYLIKNPEERKKMGKAAYETIISLWNAEHAADELVRFAKGLLRGGAVPAEEGPLSPAPVTAPRKMYASQGKKG